MVKSISGEIQRSGRRTNWKWLNRNNSAADCLITLKFGSLVHCGSTEPAFDYSRERLVGREASSGNAARIATYSSNKIGVMCSDISTTGCSQWQRTAEPETAEYCRPSREGHPRLPPHADADAVRTVT